MLGLRSRQSAAQSSAMTSGMIILGIPGEVQLVVQGLVLVGAVLLSLERSKIGIIK